MARNKNNIRRKNNKQNKKQYATKQPIVGLQQPAQQPSSTNIMDQPITKINVRILKPVKISQSAIKTTYKSASDDVQKKLNQFADWILSYVQKTLRNMLMNARRH